VKVITNTPEELELVIELPRFIVWFMVGPISVFGGLFTLALLLGGELLNGLVTGLVVAGLVTGGHYLLTQRTQLWLHGREGKVRIQRASMLDTREFEFPLEHLDGAQVSHNRATRSSDGGTSRPTSSLELVFSNTRPATRVPLSSWSVSGAGAGMLADAINDWLRDRAAQRGLR